MVHRSMSVICSGICATDSQRLSSPMDPAWPDRRWSTHQSHRFRDIDLFLNFLQPLPSVPADTPAPELPFLLSAGRKGSSGAAAYRGGSRVLLFLSKRVHNIPAVFADNAALLLPDPEEAAPGKPRQQTAEPQKSGSHSTAFPDNPPVSASCRRPPVPDMAISSPVKSNSSRNTAPPPAAGGSRYRESPKRPLHTFRQAFSSYIDKAQQKDNDQILDHINKKGVLPSNALLHPPQFPGNVDQAVADDHEKINLQKGRTTFPHRTAQRTNTKASSSR